MELTGDGWSKDASCEVCRHWNAVISDEGSWRNAFETYYGVLDSGKASLGRRLEPTTWRGEYVGRVSLLTRWAKSRTPSITYDPHLGPLNDIHINFPPPAPPRPRVRSSRPSTPNSPSGNQPALLSVSLQFGKAILSDPFTGKVSKKAFSASPTDNFGFALNPQLPLIPATSFAISPEGNKVVWGMLDGSFRVVDSSTPSGINARAWAGVMEERGERVRSLEGHRTTVGAVAFGSTGDCFASVGEDGGVALWSFSQVKPQSGTSTPVRPRELPVARKIWEAKIPPPAHPLARDEAPARGCVVALGGRGKGSLRMLTVVVGMTDGVVHVWNGVEVDVEGEPRTPVGASGWSLAGDGKKVDKLFLDIGTPDGTTSLLVHRLDDSKFTRYSFPFKLSPLLPPQPTTFGHTLLLGSLTAFAVDFAPPPPFTPSNDHSRAEIITGFESYGTTPSTEAKPILVTSPSTSSIASSTVSLQEEEARAATTLRGMNAFGRKKYVVAGDSQGRVFVWDWEADEQSGVVEPTRMIQNFQSKVTALEITDAGVFVGGLDGTLRCYDILTSTLVRTFKDRAASRLPARMLAAGLIDDEDRWKVTRIRANRECVIAAIGGRILAWRVADEVKKKGKSKSGSGKMSARTERYRSDLELRREVQESLSTLSLESDTRAAQLRHDRYVANEFGLPPSLDNMTEEEAVAFAMMLSVDEQENRWFSDSGRTSSRGSPAFEPVPEDLLEMEGLSLDESTPSMPSRTFGNRRGSLMSRAIPLSSPGFSSESGLPDSLKALLAARDAADSALQASKVEEEVADGVIGAAVAEVKTQLEDLIAVAKGWSKADARKPSPVEEARAISVEAWASTRVGEFDDHDTLADKLAAALELYQRAADLLRLPPPPALAAAPSVTRPSDKTLALILPEVKPWVSEFLAEWARTQTTFAFASLLDKDEVIDENRLADLLELSCRRNVQALFTPLEPSLTEEEAPSESRTVLGNARLIKDISTMFTFTPHPEMWSRRIQWATHCADLRFLEASMSGQRLVDAASASATILQKPGTSDQSRKEVRTVLEATIRRLVPFEKAQGATLLGLGKVMVQAVGSMYLGRDDPHVRESRKRDASRDSQVESDAGSRIPVPENELVRETRQVLIRAAGLFENSYASYQRTPAKGRTAREEQRILRRLETTYCLLEELDNETPEVVELRAQRVERALWINDRLLALGNDGEGSESEDEEDEDVDTDSDDEQLSRRTASGGISSRISGSDSAAVEAPRLIKLLAIMSSETMPSPASDEYSGTPAPKTKRRRNRKAASCTQCRARKLRCSRSIPCEACISKGLADSCQWDADSIPPLYATRERDETESLRREVDRLQGLLDVLGHGEATVPFPTTTTHDGGSSASSPHAGGPDRATSRPGVGRARPSEGSEGAEDDISSQDLAQKLGHLTIQQFLQGQNDHVTEHGSELLVKEARKILDDAASIPSSASAASPNFVYTQPANSFLFSQRSTSIQDIMRKLPRKALSDVASSSYWMSVDWAVQKGYAEDKDSVAKEWMDMASNSLFVGRFLEVPTLEAIRTLLIMAVHHISLSPGDDGGAGVAFLVLAVQGCMQLGLHRDPDKTPGRYSAFESEDRRRVFWLTFLAEQYASTTVGRRYCMLHLRDVDTRLPADVLSEAAFGLRPVTYSTIMELNHEIDALETSFPPQHRFHEEMTVTKPDRLTILTVLKSFIIQLALATERLRLHRPYLARSYSDAICASIVLAIDVLQNPAGPVATTHSTLVHEALARIEAFSEISTICRRGAKVLRFLLEKNGYSSSGDHLRPSPEPLQKRSRTATGSTGSPATSVESDLPHKATSSPPSNFARDPKGFNSAGASSGFRFPLLSGTSASSSAPSTTTSFQFDPPFPNFSSGPGMGVNLPADISSFDFEALLGMDSSQPGPFSYTPPTSQQSSSHLQVPPSTSTGYSPLLSTSPNFSAAAPTPLVSPPTTSTTTLPAFTLSTTYPTLHSAAAAAQQLASQPPNPLATQPNYAANYQFPPQPSTVWQPSSSNNRTYPAAGGSGAAAGMGMVGTETSSLRSTVHFNPSYAFGIPSANNFEFSFLSANGPSGNNGSESESGKNGAGEKGE
ncbi:F-box and WD repeat domain containing protein [Pseudohyphozyma bogoriensis]|nr:F-box and WD repeat domain containing protein [Pseudohyphozyma bogoriensis]